MRAPFLSLAAPSACTHLIRHRQSSLVRRRIPSESCRGRFVIRLPVDINAAVGVVAYGDLYRSFTTTERPPPGKNTPSSSKSKKKANFRASNDGKKESPEAPPASPSSSHRRRLVVAKQENLQDKEEQQTILLGTYKATSVVSKEIRDSYGQLILKPAPTGTAAAQWQKVLRNQNQTKASPSSSTVSASEKTIGRGSPPAASTTQNNHHHSFPMLNASVLLDTQRYIVRSGKFSATTTKSGTEAARRMLRGRKEWLQTVRKHVARGQQPATSTASNSSSHVQGGAYEIQGHGVPRQLLQNHVDFASKLLKRHGAWSVDFGAPPTTTTTDHNSKISTSSIFPETTRAAENWTMHVLGMDGDPSSYRSVPVLRDSDDVVAEDSAHSLHLYLTVMHRLATTLSIVFREGPFRQQQQQPQPPQEDEQQQQQQQPENASTVGSTGSTSFNHEHYNSAWSQSSRAAASTTSSSSSYMYPTYYDWQVEISRMQCIKKHNGEEEEEEKNGHDDVVSLKNDPTTLSTADTFRGRTDKNSRDDDKLPPNEPLLTVQWNWPVYQVALYLQGQSSLSLLEEEPNPVVTMKYAASFHPQQQQMSNRSRFS